MFQAFSYVRFSSKPQEQGDSVRRQVEAAEAYAREHGLQLDTRSYRDLGISAFKGKNVAEGALGAFLKAVDDGTIKRGSFLLVESIDRVSRENVLEALETFMSVVKRGIVLVTITDGMVYTQANINENWTKLIFALGGMATANQESAKKVERLEAAWKAKRKGTLYLTSVGPAWLKLEGPKPAKGAKTETRKWVLIPDLVRTVQYVFDLAGNQKLGTPSIAARLNEEGIPTMSSAVIWDATIVMAMLKNTSVLGIFTPKRVAGEAVMDYYPSIIEPELFDMVQQLIAGRQRTGGPKGEFTNLFSGLFSCECGAKVRFVSSNKPRYFLQCRTAYGKGACDAPKMPYNIIERSLLRNLKRDLPKAAVLVADPTIMLKAERAEMQDYLDRMVKALSLGDGAATLPTLVANMARIETEIRMLDKRISAAFKPPPVDTTHDDYVSMIEELAEATEASRRLIRERIQNQIRVLVTKIVLLKQTHKEGGDGKWDWRQLVMYGPYASRFIDAWKADGLHGIAEGSVTADGGLVFDYVLDAWIPADKRVRKPKG